MRSYQLTAFAQALEERIRPTPVPTGDEVLLRVSACGVCHSDVHLHEGYFDLGGGRRLDLSRGRELPLTLGHEIAGEVAAVGPDVTDVVVGDRRVVYPWLGCRTCSVCQRGDEHLCPSPRALGVVLDGGFADHVVVPHARYLFDFGALESTVACTYACSGLTAYSALQKVRDAAHGGHLLLIGAGGVGFAGLHLARALVDGTVIVGDIDAGRLSAARDAGAHDVVDTRSEGAVKRVRALAEGGVATAIDFVGSAESASFGVKTLRTGGTLVVVGLFGGALSLPLPTLPLKQLTIRGSFVGSLSEMAELTRLVRTGVVAPPPVRSRPLGDAQAALDDLRGGRVTGRAVLTPDHR